MSPFHHKTFQTFHDDNGLKAVALFYSRILNFRKDNHIRKIVGVYETVCLQILAYASFHFCRMIPYSVWPTAFNT